MQREVVGYFCIGLLTLVASATGAAPQVLGPDDRPLERASIVADADAFWVSHDADLPVLLRPDADDHLRFPDLSVARLLVLDAASGKPLSAGRLRWTGAGIPDDIAAVTWSVRGGRLDLGCRGGEAVELKARGYRPRSSSSSRRNAGKRCSSSRTPISRSRCGRHRPAACGSPRSTSSR